MKLGEFRRVGHGVGRLNKESASLLKWEGIVNEPVGVLPAVLTLQYFTNAGSGWQQAVLGLGMAILAAAVFGGLGGLDHLPALSPRIRTRPP